VAESRTRTDTNSLCWRDRVVGSDEYLRGRSRSLTTALYHLVRDRQDDRFGLDYITKRINPPTSSLPQMTTTRRFEFTDAKSNKFWEITVTGKNESARVCRRLHSVRGWSYAETHPIFA
jgi:hypothetical protein